MPLETVLLGFIAAGAGIAFRAASGLFAERIGHSKEEGETAAGTAGLSLIAHSRDEQPSDLSR
jgi:hypothetical protein